jgi:uncharacterized protein YdhG (YjbR/CyaY superfamily)
MPAYKTNRKALVYFAGFKNHISFYATPTRHTAFADALLNYKQGKGSVQFPLNQSIPFELIGRIVEFRVKENSAKSNKCRKGAAEREKPQTAKSIKNYFGYVGCRSFLIR